MQPHVLHATALPPLHAQEDVPPQVAETLLAAAPGLFVRAPNGKLRVTDARQHEQHLEKVGATGVEGAGLQVRAALKAQQPGVLRPCALVC